MAIKEYQFTGTVTFAFLNTVNQYGKYALNFYPEDKDQRKAVVATGTRCKPKLDKDDQVYFTFTSPEKPDVLGAEGQIVGDGSRVQVKLTVEDFVSKQHGNVTRTLLKNVDVLELKPYTPKDKPIQEAF